MALIVEDGSGLTNAQTYVSPAEVSVYCITYGLAQPASPNTAIMLAMRYLEGTFFHRWVGYKKTELQALSWPRSNAVKRDGWVVNESTVPIEVKNAVCALAIRSGLGEDLTPDFTNANMVKKEQVGPLLVEYMAGAPSYTVYKDIEFILTPVTTPKYSAKIYRT